MVLMLIWVMSELPSIFRCRISANVYQSVTRFGAKLEIITCYGCNDITRLFEMVRRTSAYARKNLVTLISPFVLNFAYTLATLWCILQLFWTLHNSFFSLTCAVHNLTLTFQRTWHKRKFSCKRTYCGGIIFKENYAGAHHVTTHAR